MTINLPPDHSVPIIKPVKPVDLPRMVEEIRIALANQRYVHHDDEERGMSNARIGWIFFWGAMLFMGVAAFVLSYSQDLMAPRSAWIIDRIAAGIFLLAVIVHFVMQFSIGDRK